MGLEVIQLFASNMTEEKFLNSARTVGPEGLGTESRQAAANLTESVSERQLR